MKNNILFLSLLFVSHNIYGKEVIEQNCQKIAKISAGIADLRDSGYTLPELEKFTTVSTIQSFPIQSLKLFVYGLTDKNTNDHVYNFCKSIGFDNFNRFLLQFNEIESLKLQNNNLQKQLDQIKSELDELDRYKNQVNECLKKKYLSSETLKQCIAK